MVFKSMDAFKKHIQSHGNEFRCSQPNCSQRDHVFKTVGNLSTHVNRTHGSELFGNPSFYFRCGHCEEPSTLRKANVLHHIKNHHFKPSMKRKISTLAEVERCCLPPGDLSDHIRTFILAPQFANKAAALAVQAFHLAQPLANHTLQSPALTGGSEAEPEAPVRRWRGKTLTICPEHHQMVFESRDAFKEHIQSHGNEFRCSHPNCSSSGRVYRTLRLCYSHVTKSHGSEVFGKTSVSFQCGHCQKPSTFRKGNMLDHVRVHHLTSLAQLEISNPLQVERYCLPPEDPSSSIRTFTLATEFFNEIENESTDSQA